MVRAGTRHTRRLRLERMSTGGNAILFSEHRDGNATKAQKCRRDECRNRKNEPRQLQEVKRSAQQNATAAPSEMSRRRCPRSERTVCRMFHGCSELPVTVNFDPARQHGTENAI